MYTQVVFLAAVTVLLHVSAGRGFTIKSQNNEDQLDADRAGTRQVSRESDVSNEDLDTGNLVLIKESVRNDLHDIRRRQARSTKQSRKRQAGPGDESGVDQRRESKEKALVSDITEFLEPKKEMIINFMKPILDRIKHKPNEASHDNPSDTPTSPAPPTPLSPSSTPSGPGVSTPSGSGFSTPSGPGVSTPSDSGDSTPSGSPTNIFQPFPFSFTKCGADEKHRNTNTLSLLFPDLKSSKGEQPFVFVPLTNTLMRVVEQQIIKESQSVGDPKSKL